MLSFIPVSLLYSLPMVPVFLVGMARQNRYHRVIDELGGVATGQLADEVARRVLKKNGLDDIPVARGDDFSMNAFDSDSGKVLLSPETMGQKDVSSIGIAIYAVSPLVAERLDSAMCWLNKQLVMWQVILFWCTFSVLSFGLMSASIPWIAFGYLMAVATYGLRVYNIHVREQESLKVVSQLDEMNMFRPDELSKVRAVVSALAHHHA